MPIQIGIKFTGKYAGHMDTTTGTYWEVLPKIEGDALYLQSRLLQPRAQVGQRTTVGGLLRRLLPAPIGLVNLTAQPIPISGPWQASGHQN